MRGAFGVRRFVPEVPPSSAATAVPPPEFAGEFGLPARGRQYAFVGRSFISRSAERSPLRLTAGAAIHFPLKGGRGN